MIMNPYNKKNEGAIAGPGQLSYSFEHLHMEKPKVSFSSCQRNLIKTFQIEGMIALITKMTFIFSSDL